MGTDKVIVTNMGALKKKYGAAAHRILKALDRLVAADKKRGIEGRIVAIDSARDMAAFRGQAVAAVGDRRAAKAAIDAVYHACRPDYILILGAPDIVPHQELKNPAYDPNGDDDEVIPTDIPYACDAGYSTNPGKFIGPTRVVGRMPDLPGVSDPSYLVSLLGTAAGHKTRVRADYQRYFSVSAEVWKGSTFLSLTKLFGSGASMALSPPKGPSWKGSQMAPRMHFINCHGAKSDPNFYGQRGNSYPVAHSSKNLVRKIMNGTVVAVECCYGAELYNPGDSDNQPGICSTYLRDGAYGYFGSSTIAYGPSEGNGQADLICQYFLDEVINGSSLGEAALRARHRFASAYTHLDPTDLKTMVQFFLLGDPSIHPVAAASHSLARTKTYNQIFKAHQNVKGTRMLRREKDIRTGINLSGNLGTAGRADEEVPFRKARLLESAAKEAGVRKFKIIPFNISFPRERIKGCMKQIGEARKGRMIYMLTGKRNLPRGAPGRVVSLTMTLQDGEVIHMRRLHSR